MKVTRSSELRAALAERGIHPSRALGQNFLVDENIIRIIADAATLEGTETVLEIGPGAGALTEALLSRAKRVIAIEKDHRLAAWLRERFAQGPRLEIMEADALDVDLESIFKGGCRALVSNLPYSAGTRILVETIHADSKPARIVATVQTEVAGRVLSLPGGDDYGLLSVWVQRLYQAEIIRRIPGSCFWPAPEVESSVLRLTLRDQPLARVESMDTFTSVTRFFFGQRRKQMQKILQAWPHLPDQVRSHPAEWLARVGIDPQWRPEKIGPVEWAALSNALHGTGRAG